MEFELLASDSGYIKILTVIEALRGQGLGTQLFRFAERFRGPDGMSTIVGNHDAASWRLLERNGFAEVACRPLSRRWLADTGDRVDPAQGTFRQPQRLIAPVGLVVA